MKVSAPIIVPKMQTNNHSLRNLLAICGVSSIRPVVTRVISDMNRNEKGNDTLAFVRGISSIRISPESNPNMRKLSIIRELSTCRTLVVSIRYDSLVNISHNLVIRPLPLSSVEKRFRSLHKI